MRSFYALTLLASLAVCAPAFADVTLQGLAGGDVVTASLPVTLSTQDFFYTTLDSGTTGSAAPSWLSVTPTEGYTNVQIQITADPSRLQAGSVSGRIVLTFPNGEPTVTQTVTFQVASAPPKLDVFPTSINMDGVNGDFIPVSAAVFVRNAGGGGPQPFTATLTGDAPFLKITSSSNTTNQNSPALTIQGHGNALSQDRHLYGESAHRVGQSDPGCADNISRQTRPPVFLIDQVWIVVQRRAGRGHSTYADGGNTGRQRAGRLDCNRDEHAGFRDAFSQQWIGHAWSRAITDHRREASQHPRNILRIGDGYPDSIYRLDRADLSDRGLQRNFHCAASGFVASGAHLHSVGDFGARRSEHLDRREFHQFTTFRAGFGGELSGGSGRYRLRVRQCAYADRCQRGRRVAQTWNLPGRGSGEPSAAPNIPDG
jgi:hypothetical protein